MMKKDKKQKLKLNFPYEAIMALMFLLLAIVTCICQYLINCGIEYLLIVLGAFIAMCFFGLLFNETYKNLIITGEEIKVRYWIGLNSITLKKQDIKGYKIKETCTRYGIDYQIQIVPIKGKKIEFIKDAYTNYERLEFYLKSFGVRYIGTENTNSPFKKISSKIIVLGASMLPVLYLLLQLLKSTK